MIELNLLPKELRKQKKGALPEINAVPVSVGIVGVLVLVYVVVFFLVMRSEGLSRKLKSEWEKMGPQREKTEEIIREINDLKKKVDIARKIAKPELDWARLLSGLNQAMMPGIWLTEFKPVFGAGAGKEAGADDSPVSLDLTGYAQGKSDTATALTGRFISSLKRNEDFFYYFDEIELKNITKHEVSGEECMLFKLTCSFKKNEPAGKKTKSSRGR